MHLEDSAFLLSSSLPAPVPSPFLKAEAASYIPLPESPLPTLAFPAPSHRHNLSTSSAPPMIFQEAELKQEPDAI
jgi:hypothetical protein